ncbi:MAG TPA: LacI family DNA-binding transcriptional regulator [Thermotogota bacterium]|nr:LacI family DNA-binding transcriptional regulator [Thermotogota bacterium]HPR97550.1 LacI family DNA-binding transcriptional regulator [Thermotogota bacterium]
MKISLKEISQLTGFSMSTISRALKNDKRISEETKLKIFKAAQGMGYKDGQIPENSKVILFFIANPHESIESDEFFSVVQDGVLESATKSNYHCLVQSMSVGEDFNNALIPLDLISGIICGGIPMPDSLKEFLLRLRIPVVMIGNYDRLEHFGAVNNDNTKGGFLAASQIFESTYENNWIVSGPRRLHTFSDRIEGYFRYVRETGINTDSVKLFELDEFDERSGRCFIENHLNSLEKNTSIFCTTDWLARGILEGLNHSSLSMPDDVGLMGFGGLSFCNHTSPKISTISLKPYLLGKISFMMLQELIDGNERSKGTVFVEPSITVGETLREVVK